MSRKLKLAVAGAAIALALVFGIVWGDVAHFNSAQTTTTQAGVVFTGASVAADGVIWGD